MADESHSVTAAEATTDTVSKQVAPANGEKPTDASVAGVEGNTAAEGKRIIIQRLHHLVRLMAYFSSQ